jgi:hypothetical protein
MIWGRAENIDIVDLDNNELENFIPLSEFEKVEYMRENGIWLPKLLTHVPRLVWDHPEYY